MGNVAGLLSEAEKLADSERVELLGSLLEKEGSLGLSRLLSSLEKRLGVERAGSNAQTPTDSRLVKPEGPTSFDVILKSAGPNKINVIKVIREVTGLDLMGAKGLADKGGDVKKGLPKEEADALVKKLKDASGEVEVKPA